MVQVGPMVYRVSTDEERHRQYCDDLGRYYYGWADHQHLTINLDPHLPPGQMQDTLLHEVEHCLWSVSGLRGRMKLTEEDIIRHLTSLRLDTLQRNPMVVAYLMQKEDN